MSIATTIRALRAYSSPYMPHATRALAMAHRAGKETLRYFRTGLAVNYKKDGSPVTQADRNTEKVLRRMLHHHYPTHAVVGEEYGSTRNIGDTMCWYIDPIDGTQSFIHGIPLYTVLIALYKGITPLLGVIYNPPLQEVAVAITGLPTLYNGRVATISKSPPQRARLQFSDGAILEREAPGLLGALMATCTLARTWCDAYGYLMLVSGRAEVVLDGNMQPWDSAPLYPIVAGAGGHISDWDGTPDPLGYRQKGCLACSTAVLDKVQATVAAHR